MAKVTTRAHKSPSKSKPSAITVIFRWVKLRLAQNVAGCTSISAPQSSAHLEPAPTPAASSLHPARRSAPLVHAAPMPPGLGQYSLRGPRSAARDEGRRASSSSPLAWRARHRVVFQIDGVSTPTLALHPLPTDRSRPKVPPSRKHAQGRRSQWPSAVRVTRSSPAPVALAPGRASITARSPRGRARPSASHLAIHQRKLHHPARITVPRVAPSAATSADAPHTPDLPASTSLVDCND